jgi:hypothetical protein
MINYQRLIFGLSLLISVAATVFSLNRNLILAYGDAESHLNIAKRVVDCLQPGPKQLGGVWLPLPHLLMAPLVSSDYLWQSGLAGSIVSGASFALSSLVIYKLAQLLTKSTFFSFLASLAFMVNPNILYLQTTPLNELLFILFFLLSVGGLVFYLRENKIWALLAAGFFGLGTSLIRYDGWFLVAFEGLILIIATVLNVKKGSEHSRATFGLTLFFLFAFLGIFSWLAWNRLLFHDPFFFSRSAFSGQVQQDLWINRGVLLTKGNPFYSLVYYLGAVVDNFGFLASIVAFFGFGYFLLNKHESNRFLIAALLVSPFIFNVASLFLGHSVLFVPFVVPAWSPWKLFNVRYGALMIPSLAIFFGYFLSSKPFGKEKLCRWGGMGVLGLQILMVVFGLWQVNTINEGTIGVAKAPETEAEGYLRDNYDGGLVLLDEFSRSASIIRSGLPMKSIVYIGIKPLWEYALEKPEDHVRWIITKRQDALWQNFFDNGPKQERLYQNFQPVFSSEETQVFKKY